jgi:DNA-binding transcriptional ArsR family regulator
VIQQFVVYHIMDCEASTVAAIAAAIGEPARARMLFCLMDGCARTSTELSVVAEVSPSTASAHLARLKDAALVSVLSQGKHRYYSLGGPEVGAALEGLIVLAGGARGDFAPSAPPRLRAARTCYDHIAGRLGVFLHDRFTSLAWLTAAYEPTPSGTEGFSALGIDLGATLARRRRFACACLDWSERRPHLGGALGAAVLQTALRRRWLTKDLDSRALDLTELGRRELTRRLGGLDLS